VAKDERLGIVMVNGPEPDFVKSVNGINVVGAYVLSVLLCVNEIDTISTLVMSWLEENTKELPVVVPEFMRGRLVEAVDAETNTGGRAVTNMKILL
jgi:hypothetical protein